jgi:hypothetical protein
LGLAVNYAFGSRSDVQRRRDFYVIDGDDSFSSEEKQDLSGFNAVFGGRLKIGRRVALGVACETQLKVQGDLRRSYTASTGVDTISTTTGRIDYPAAVRAGARFLPRNNPRTVFVLEVEWKNWSALADNRVEGSDPNLRDTWDVRTGVEHRFYNDVAMRFGFRRYQNYAERDVGTSVFAAGLGVPITSGRLAASVEISKTTAILAHQFPYPEEFLGDQYVVDPEARVEDTRFRFGIGYSGRF